MMDGLLPMGSYPVEIAGRNRLWRKIIIEAIRSDPAWKNGDYTQQPPSLAVLESLEGMMAVRGEHPRMIDDRGRDTSLPDAPRTDPDGRSLAHPVLISDGWWPR